MSIKEQSVTQRAVDWILAAPEGKPRSQKDAALKFGITQAAVSIGIKSRFRKTGGVRPDARRRPRSIGGTKAG